MTSDLHAARVNLSRALARRLVPVVPVEYLEGPLAFMLDRQLGWIFDDAAEHGFALGETLQRAAFWALENLQADIGEEAKAPWPASKVAPWPESEAAGLDTNRQPWSLARGGAIHLGYGEGETAALALESITYDELRQGPVPAELKELR